MSSGGAGSDGQLRQKIKPAYQHLQTVSHGLIWRGGSPLWSSLSATLRAHAKLMASRPRGVRMQGLAAGAKQSVAGVVK
eukprot:9502845-Pyramimonas_sp.AAC.1